MSPKRLSIGIALAMIAVPGLVRAQPDDERKKIESLIQHLEGLEDAVFIRNGREYDAKTAGKFLRGKWDANERRIETAEDFIKHAASFSSTSGKSYHIRLKPTSLPVKSGDYLRACLLGFDEQADKGHKSLEAYFSLVQEGAVEKAVKLADPDSAVPEQTPKLQNIGGVAELQFKQIYGCFREVVGITDGFEIDGQQQFLVLTARLIDEKWLVVDIDVEDADGLAGEIARFREDYPEGKLLKPAAANVPARKE